MLFELSPKTGGALSFSITSILNAGSVHEDEDEEEIDVGNEDAETDDERVVSKCGVQGGLVWEHTLFSLLFFGRFLR